MFSKVSLVCFILCFTLNFVKTENKKEEVDSNEKGKSKRVRGRPTEYPYPPEDLLDYARRKCGRPIKALRLIEDEPSTSGNSPQEMAKSVYPTFSQGFKKERTPILNFEGTELAIRKSGRPKIESYLSKDIASTSKILSQVHPTNTQRRKRQRTVSVLNFEGTELAKRKTGRPKYDSNLAEDVENNSEISLQETSSLVYPILSSEINKPRSSVVSFEGTVSDKIKNDGSKNDLNLTEDVGKNSKISLQETPLPVDRTISFELNESRSSILDYVETKLEKQNSDRLRIESCLNEDVPNSSSSSKITPHKLLTPSSIALNKPSESYVNFEGTELAKRKSGRPRRKAYDNRPTPVVEDSSRFCQEDNVQEIVPNWTTLVVQEYNTIKNTPDLKNSDSNQSSSILDNFSKSDPKILPLGLKLSKDKVLEDVQKMEVFEEIAKQLEPK